MGAEGLSGLVGLVVLRGREALLKYVLRPPIAQERITQGPEGLVRIVSQATRDQARNREDARDKLADLIRRALVAPKPRRPTRPTRGAKRRRREDKARRAGTKQLRRRVGADD